ncbi:hypothetical protein DRA43_20895 [Micromonospora provocatoris]|nr:hypothetical protein [Micromonospora provocatoris]RBJ00581.1 hypothetical protein DRA43_20895 [Micromonospora provocatoris]
MVDDVRRRLRSGELSADLDPAYVVLTFFAAAMAPTVLPQVIRRLTGLAADSPEFLDAYAARLRRVLGHLGGDTPPPDRPGVPSGTPGRAVTGRGRPRRRRSPCR